MSQHEKSILIADPDSAAVRKLGAALRARGHRVLTVKDGSKALEVSVMQVPDVIFYDVACPLLDARTFARILRANARTQKIPIVVVGTDEVMERMRPGGLREAFIRKPFNLDEVLARVRQLFRRAEAAEEVRAEGAIEGALDQIGLPDLLQILAINRRSGMLRLKGTVPWIGAEQQGEALLREGRIIDATLGEVGGEKALFRLLSLGRGSFSFIPGMPAGAGRIQRSMDEALLEGMRQRDELEALQERAPGRSDRLSLEVDPRNLPEGLHPVTLEMIRLIEVLHTMAEVVDRAHVPDLEATRAIVTLAERGMVRVLRHAEGEAQAVGRRLVNPEVVYGLHGRFLSQHPGRRAAYYTLSVSARGPAALRALVQAMSEIEGWRASADPSVDQLGFGSLGRVSLTDQLQIELVALPSAPAFAPLRRPFGGQSAGLLVLAEAEEEAGLEALAQWFAQTGRPVGVVGGAQGLPGRIGEVAFWEAEPVAGLGRLLGRVVSPPPGDAVA